MNSGEAMYQLWLHLQLLMLINCLYAHEILPQPRKGTINVGGCRVRMVWLMASKEVKILNDHSLKGGGSCWLLCHVLNPDRNSSN